MIHKDIFLRSYDEQLINEVIDTLQNGINTLPFTLAKPIQLYFEALELGLYGKAMNSALDFFEISTCFISSYLCARLQKEKITINDAIFKKVVDKIDVKRPLSFGDWANDILQPLLKLAAIYLKEDVIALSLVQHLVAKKSNILLGDKQNASIIKIRNEYKGHSTTLSEDIYKQVVYTLEERFLKMIKGILPFNEALFFSPLKEELSGDKRIYNIKSFTASNTSTLFSLAATEDALTLYHYYMVTPKENQNLNRKNILDLHPLIVFDHEKFVYVFHTLHDEKIAYLSSDINAINWVTDEHNNDFDTFFQSIVPSFDIAKDKNWDELHALMQKESESFVAQVVQEKKYNKQHFVNRKSLSEPFDIFLKSQAQLLPLIGEAGQGKTNQLCHWVEDLIEKKRSVLIFNSSNFAYFTLEDKLKSIFTTSKRKNIQRLLHHIHDKALEANEEIIFFFDAINECLCYKDNGTEGSGALPLYKAIEELLLQTEYTAFKVVMTCRNYTWCNEIQPRINPALETKLFLPSKGENYELKGFSDEELTCVYDKYRNDFQLRTSSLEILNRKIVIRLKDPLVFKMACINHLNHELPTDVSDYSSLSIFLKLYKNLQQSYAGEAQCNIIKGLAQEILRNYEEGNPIDHISINELKKAKTEESHPLRCLANLVFTNTQQTTEAYNELLNDRKRPIIRVVAIDAEQKELQIQFIYERFLEYILAVCFIEKHRIHLKDNELIPFEIYQEAIQQKSSNVVYMGALRNALIMEYQATQNNANIFRLAASEENEHEALFLISDLLNKYIQENYEKDLYVLLKLFITYKRKDIIPSAIRHQALKKTIEKNKAVDKDMLELKALEEQMHPIIRVRKLASSCIINAWLRSDYVNEQLYQDDYNLYLLIERLIEDPIDEIANHINLNIYYLTHIKTTLNGEMLNENLCFAIVERLFDKLNEIRLSGLIVSKQKRTQLALLLELAVRLSLLMIIDFSLSKEKNNEKKVTQLLDRIEDTIKHFTFNFTLLRLAKPFLRPLMRKQITVQNDYVNNAMEYQSFWTNVPTQNDKKKWSKAKISEVIVFLNQETTETSFTDYHLPILDAYLLGDSLSYFVLERVLIAKGVADWETIAPIIRTFYTPKYEATEWFDYSQMSILYVLSQIIIHGEPNKELYDFFNRGCEDWTRRCKGVFKARNSDKANANQYYKRNVMNWYCVGNRIHKEDLSKMQGEVDLSTFYSIITDAFKNKDKVLFYHCIDNIIELITDFGYIDAALQLTGYIVDLFSSETVLKAFDAIVVERQNYNKTMAAYFKDLMSTARKYFPKQTNRFITEQLKSKPFSKLIAFNEEMLLFSEGGETVGDLLTHKFGFFLMHSLLNNEAFKAFAIEAVKPIPSSKDSFDWYDKVVSTSFKHLFNIKI